MSATTQAIQPVMQECQSVADSHAGALSDVERAQRFGVFAAEYRDRALRLAWRLLGGNDAAAEDVVQEALIRGFRALSSFRGDAALSTWFYRILVREVRRHQRWAGVRARWNSPELGDEADPLPRGTPDVLLRDRIARAMEKLPRGQREVFVLVHLEAFTVVQAAEALGKSPGTVKSHLHRALVALRKELADLREGAPS